MSLLAFAFPSAFPDFHLITGLEDDTDGSLRVYVGPRWKGIHTHVDDEEAKKQLRSQFGWGHIGSTVPREALCDCPPPEEEAHGVLQPEV